MTNAHITPAAANIAVHTLAHGLAHLSKVTWSNERDAHIATCPDCSWTAEARSGIAIHADADMHYATAWPTPLRLEPVMTATAMDYLIRAGDAFVATLPLHTPEATRLDHQRAGRLADYAWRCAELAARAAGKDPEQFEVAVAAHDMSDRAYAVTTAIRATRSSRSVRKVA